MRLAAYDEFQFHPMPVFCVKSNPIAYRLFKFPASFLSNHTHPTLLWPVFSFTSRIRCRCCILAYLPPFGSLPGMLYPICQNTPRQLSKSPSNMPEIHMLAKYQTRQLALDATLPQVLVGTFHLKRPCQDLRAKSTCRSPRKNFLNNH
jgi:hypothetical protein